MNATKRLDPLINLHRLRRGILKQLTAALKAQRQDLADRLRDLGQEWMRVRTWNTEVLASGSAPMQGVLTERWMASAERESVDIDRRMSDLGRQIQDAEKRLMRASQDLKMLSTLQQRRAARERELALKREQKDLDEMASHCVSLS